jgi:methylated-DNA-[protein]-cysteine S-methyltransferase
MSWNPVLIMYPCHRVISSRGTLCGYSGGLENKTALLELEIGLYCGSLFSDE